METKDLISNPERIEMYESMANFRKIFGRKAVRSIEKEYYQWKILHNPYKRGHIYLERRNGGVIGSTTITPRSVAILGEALIAAEIGDTFTHPAYRRQGIFSKGVAESTEYAVSSGINIIYGTPNELSLQGYQKKLGYPPCPFAKIKYMVKYTHALPIERRVVRKLGKNFLSKLLARVYYYSLSLRTHAQRRQKKLRKLSAKVSLVKRFDREWDGIWGDSRKDYAFFTIRDKTYLNWRFFRNPDDYIVLLASTNEAYLGYVVIKISKIGELLVGTICDFVTYKDREDVFYKLIAEAEKKLNKIGVHYIQLLCSESSPYFRPLISSGYLIRGNRPVIVFSETKLGRKIIEKDMKWHFTFADSDNI